MSKIQCLMEAMTKIKLKTIKSKRAISNKIKLMLKVIFYMKIKLQTVLKIRLNRIRRLILST